MSLSEMSKATYKKHRASIRANGLYHGLKWIKCPLEREDMKAIHAERMSIDWLAERAFFQRFDPPMVAFYLTSYLTLNKPHLNKGK